MNHVLTTNKLNYFTFSYATGHTGDPIPLKIAWPQNRTSNFLVIIKLF